MWEEIVKDETGEMIEEVDARSTALGCSLEVAHYVIKLEERLDRIEKDLYDEIARLRADHDLLVGQVQDLSNDLEHRHDIITEQIDHTQTVLQDSLEKQWESGR